MDSALYHKLKSIPGTQINSKTIPGEGASMDEMLEHLRNVVSFSTYSDDALNSASMYQSSTELGYYSSVRDLSSVGIRKMDL